MKFKKYKAEDFLSDDDFFKLIYRPKRENNEFWNTLLNSEEINYDELVSAYLMLKKLPLHKQEVPEHQIKRLWKKIKETNQKEKKKKSKSRVLARYRVAASIAILMIGFSTFAVLRDWNLDRHPFFDNQRSTVDIGLENQPNEKIELVSGEFVMNLDGSNADVVYNENGSIIINNQSIGMEDKKDTHPYQLKVPYGKRATLKLSDGSQIWVNSGSTIIYPSTFNKNAREIFVEGEVYLEVEPNKDWPFIVTSDQMEIRVLGTSFNLTAYKDEKQTKLVLVDGSVLAKPKNGNVIEMEPNQMLSINQDASSIQTVDVSNYISWRDGIYTFRSESIENILLRLSRYYNVIMKLPSTYSGITCSGKLVMRENLTQLLDGLSSITPMRYKITEDNECIIFFDPSP